ncbi:MAG: TetR family transcriptional regulator [Actinomycetota bacterium]
MAKSDRTRARLQQVALDLIAEHGFEATTVQQISVAAGVSPMTFFRYFSTKEAVVLNDPFDPHIAAAVAAQPGHLTPLSRACRGLRAGVAGLYLPEEQQVRQRVRILAQSPHLAAGVWANTAATQEVVAAALAQHAPETDARVAAAAVIAALTVALLDWGARDDEDTLVACLRRALDVLDPAPVKRKRA